MATNPIILENFAQNGIKAKPSTSRQNNGYIESAEGLSARPLVEEINYMFNEIFILFNFIRSQGNFEWQTNVNYGNGSMIQYNGVIYKGVSPVENTPPSATNPNQWIKIPTETDINAKIADLQTQINTNKTNILTNKNNISALSNRVALIENKLSLAITPAFVGVTDQSGNLLNSKKDTNSVLRLTSTSGSGRALIVRGSGFGINTTVVTFSPRYNFGDQRKVGYEYVSASEIHLVAADADVRATSFAFYDIRDSFNKIRRNNANNKTKRKI